MIVTLFNKKIKFKISDHKTSKHDFIYHFTDSIDIRISIDDLTYNIIIIDNNIIVKRDFVPAINNNLKIAIQYGFSLLETYINETMNKHIEYIVTLGNYIDFPNGMIDGCKSYLLLNKLKNK